MLIGGQETFAEYVTFKQRPRGDEGVVLAVSGGRGSRKQAQKPQGSSRAHEQGPEWRMGGWRNIWGGGKGMGRRSRLGEVFQMAVSLGVELPGKSRMPS